MRIEAIAWFDMPKNGKWHGQNVMPQQELIRCKDCVHCIPQGEDGDWFYCEVWWKQVRTDLTDYCSRAERKEE